MTRRPRLSWAEVGPPSGRRRGRATSVRGIESRREDPNGPALTDHGRLVLWHLGQGRTRGVAVGRAGGRHSHRSKPPTGAGAAGGRFPPGRPVVDRANWSVARRLQGGLRGTPSSSHRPWTAEFAWPGHRCLVTRRKTSCAPLPGRGEFAATCTGARIRPVGRRTGQERSRSEATLSRPHRSAR
jgi:hypothetical protein